MNTALNGNPTSSEGELILLKDLGFEASFETPPPDGRESPTTNRPWPVVKWVLDRHPGEWLRLDNVTPSSGTILARDGYQTHQRGSVLYVRKPFTPGLERLLTEPTVFDQANGEVSA